MQDLMVKDNPFIYLNLISLLFMCPEYCQEYKIKKHPMWSTMERKWADRLNVMTH